MNIIPCLIGVDYQGNSTYHVPAHDENTSLYEVSCLNYSDIELVEEICKKSKIGFMHWSNLKFNKRIEILKNVCIRLQARKQELIDSFSEVGLPPWFCEFNAENIVTQLEDYLSHIADPKGVILNSEQEFAMSVRTPIGPVLAIAPWNAPGVLAGRAISAPLAAGCSVVIKTNELAAKCTYIIVKCFHEGGVPLEALQMVNVRPEDNKYIVERFISNKHIKKISFTGSSKTGSEIASTAGKYLKPCLLELGGKNYTIIEADADMDRAIAATLFGAWGHKGQICMSTDKIFVDETIYDKFVEKMKIIGTEFSKNADFQIPQRIPAYDNAISRMLDEASRSAAEYILGPYIDFRYGYPKPVSPTILTRTDINPEARINTDEIFGPVACLYTFSNSTELVEQLNENESYGLKASIWSKNVFKAQKLANLIETGGVHINSSTIYDEPTAPHGGVKNSGYGRFNSTWGIEEFSYVKVITMNE